MERNINIEWEKKDSPSFLTPEQCTTLTGEEERRSRAKISVEVGRANGLCENAFTITEATSYVLIAEQAATVL